MKRAFYLYQKAMWFLAQTVNEAHKPLLLLNESLLLVTFLTVRGVEIDLITSIFIYLGVIVAGVVIGKVLTDIGVIEYNTRLTNVQNPEIQEILKVVKRLEKKAYGDD